MIYIVNYMFIQQKQQVLARTKTIVLILHYKRINYLKNKQFFFYVSKLLANNKSFNFNSLQQQQKRYILIEKFILFLDSDYKVLENKCD